MLMRAYPWLWMECLMRLSLMMCAAVLVIVCSSDVCAKEARPVATTLEQCPDKPNCVSSQGPEGPRKMAAIPFHGSLKDARERLLAVIRSFPRTTVVKDDGNHIKAEFRSALFSFVDDIEFAFDDMAKRIHFRSASRTGYYDFGVNRKRMEEVSRRFSAK